jgi:hypothetical protein
MATAKLIETLLRAAKNADVRRAAAEALITLVVIALRAYKDCEDDHP